MWGEPLPERVGAVWGSGFWNFWIDGLWTTKWNVLWHALQSLHAEIQDWRLINRFEVLQHFSNDIMFFGGVNKYTKFRETTMRWICQCFTISSPSKLSSAAWFFEGSAPLDWRSLGFDYVPTKSHIRWGHPIGENGWFYPRKSHIRDSCPGSDSVQGWLLDGDTVWNLFVFVTLFSFNATVIVTHCKRLEHLHGVRLERCFWWHLIHKSHWIAALPRLRNPGMCWWRMGTPFEWSKKGRCFRDPAAWHCNAYDICTVYLHPLGFWAWKDVKLGMFWGFAIETQSEPTKSDVRTVVFGGRKL